MMDNISVEEIELLYFRLRRKSPLPPNEYTMTEIEKIAENAIGIIKAHNANHEALAYFEKVIKKSDKYHTGCKHRETVYVYEVKDLAMQAFQELFDREPGINV